MHLRTTVLTRIDRLLEKAAQVGASHRPNPPGVIGFPTLDAAIYAEWRSQSLAFLRDLLGPTHTYVTSFETVTNKAGHPASASAGEGVLRAVRDDVEQGYFRRFRSLVEAEVFTDFLDMAEHLLESGYKDPAASLTGAVLEDGLRSLAQAHDISAKEKDDISALNQKCAAAGAYSRLVQKKVQVWSDIRNAADHGHFDRYTADDVRAMQSGVQGFLADHL